MYSLTEEEIENLQKQMDEIKDQLEFIAFRLKDK